jgi:hypothetical protein
MARRSYLGGVRVVPRTGGGVRIEREIARLKANISSITVKPIWGGDSLVVTRENMKSVVVRRHPFSTTIMFDVEGLDELWRFGPWRATEVLARLAELGWPVVLAGSS